MGRSRYWLNLFSGKTWREFQAAGGGVTGFRETQKGQVKKIKVFGSCGTFSTVLLRQRQ